MKIVGKILKGILYIVVGFVVFLVGSIVADIHYSVITMLISILMGVGTDYGIFIVARYWEERIKGHNREEVVARVDLLPA